MNARLAQHRALPLLALATALAAASPTRAQAPPGGPVVTDIVPDFDPGRDLGTTLASNAGTHTIDGGTLAGANLFHSFASFSLAQGEIARWVQSSGNPASIVHVINRVTGGGTSFLSGTLDSSAIPNADFWFVNPAGIVFGTGAQVNVPAAAHFSTASSLGLADGTRFEIATPDGSTLSVAPPESFGFLGGEADILFAADDRIATPGRLTLTAANVGLLDSSLLASAIMIAAVGADEAEVLLDGSADSPLTGQLSLSGSELNTIASARGDGTLTINGGDVALADSQLGVFTLDATRGGGLTIAADTVGLVDGSRLVASSSLAAAGDSGGIVVTARDSVGVFDSRIQADAQGSGDGGNVRIAAPAITLDNAQLAALTFAEGNGGNFTVEATGTLISTDTSVFNSSLGTGATGSVLLHGGSVSLTGLFVGAQPGSGGGAGSVGDIRIVADGELSIVSGNITTETFGAGKAGDVSIAGGTISLVNVDITSSTTNFSDDGTPGDAGSIDIAATGAVMLDTVNLSSAAEAQCFELCPSGNAGSIRVSGGDIAVFDSNFRSEVFGNGNAGAIGVIASGTLDISDSDLRSGAFADDEGLSDGGFAGDITLSGDDVMLAFSTVSASTLSGDGGRIRFDALGALRITGESFVSSDTFGFGNAGGISLTGSSIEISDFSELGSNSFGAGDAAGIDVTADTISIDTAFLSSDAGSTGAAGFISLTAQNATLNNAQLTSDSTDAGRAGDISIAVGASGSPGVLTITDSMLSSDGLANGDAGNVVIDVAGTLDIAGSVLSSGARNDFVTTTTANAGRVFIGATDLTLRDSFVSIDTFGSGFGNEIRIDARSILIDDSTISSQTFADGDGGDVFIGGIVFPGGFPQAVTTIRDSTITSNTFGTGNASLIFVDGNFIRIDGSQIMSNSSAEGLAGRISIGFRSFVELFGSNVRIGESTLSTGASGLGDAGRIDVFGATIAIADSNLTSSTSADGNAGAVNLEALGSLAVDGSRIASSATGLGFAGLAGFVGLSAPTVDLANSQVETDSRSTGVLGLIAISSDFLTLDNSSITANTFNGSKDDDTHGLIIIEGYEFFDPAQSIVLRNGSAISTNTDGPGDGGDIIITSERVDLFDSMIQAKTIPCADACDSGGPAGTITIATDTLTVSGSDPENRAAITSNTETDGIAGRIALVGLGIVPSKLTVTGSQASISSQSLGTGDAGSIEIVMDRVEIVDGGRITTTTSETASGIGGNIKIDAADAVVIRNGGKIEADTKFECLSGDCGIQGRGGTIDIVSGTLTLTGDGQADTTYIRANSQGTADAGQITLTIAGDLTATDSAYVSSDALGDGRSGGLTVTVGDELSLASGAFLSSDVRGTGNAGNVMVEAKQIKLENARISSDARDASAGNAGTVTVMADELTVSGSKVSSDTGVASSGNAGDVRVTIGGAARIDEAGSITSNSQGSGRGGNVGVTAGTRLDLIDFAAISANALGNGQGGSVALAAPIIVLRNLSSISSDAFGAGNSGAVTVSGGTIRLSEDSFISSDSLGTGSARTVQVSASGELTLDGSSYISADAGGGDGGDVLVEAGTLRLSDGSFISSNVIDLGNPAIELDGNAGTVTVEVDGLLSLDSLSSISSDTDIGTTGDSGDVSVSARDIRLSSSAITSNTMGEGDAQSVFIEATNRLDLRDLSIISSNSEGAGIGGLIFIKTPVLNLTGSLILTNAFGTGDAGLVAITAGTVTLTDSTIVSEASEALGGFFDLDIAGALTLDGSTIRTNSTGAGDAGGMQIDAGSVVLGRESSISSDATETSTGNSGFIQLTVAGPLTIKEGSFISTSSANANPAGPIEITAGKIGLEGSALPNLPNNPANARITSSNTGTGDAGSIDIIQTTPGLDSGITLSEGAVITTSSSLANAGQITIDMAPGSILRLTGRTENALIDTSSGKPGGAGGGLVQIGQTSAPYAVILNGGSILALGQPNPDNLKINADFLIRSADRENRIAIGNGEEVDSQFEDVSSGTVATNLDVVDASRVLSGACPSARARGGQFSQFARPLIGPYAVAVEAVDPPAPVSLRQTGTALAALSGGRACR